MAPTIKSQEQHQRRNTDKIISLDALIGILVAIGAILFLVLVAAIIPRVIRYRREFLTKRHRENLERLEKTRARVGGGSSEGAGSSRRESEVSRDTSGEREEAGEQRGRSRVPKPLLAAGVRPLVEPPHSNQAGFDTVSSASETKIDISS
ncbi:hypothetical protein TWF718_010857 [Orbilia javanica]|uniref:Uncharacterized protein n=1 Tax=Orbilia javanica TaxID=47235 RepID=A0AAN8MSU9_9PEZI